MADWRHVVGEKKHILYNIFFIYFVWIFLRHLAFSYHVHIFCVHIASATKVNLKYDDTITVKKKEKENSKQFFSV